MRRDRLVRVSVPFRHVSSPPFFFQLIVIKKSFSVKTYFYCAAVKFHLNSYKHGLICFHLFHQWLGDHYSLLAENDWWISCFKITFYLVHKNLPRLIPGMNHPRVKSPHPQTPLIQHGGASQVINTVFSPSSHTISSGYPRDHREKMFRCSNIPGGTKKTLAGWTFKLLRFCKHTLRNNDLRYTASLIKSMFILKMHWSASSLCTVPELLN